MLLYCVASFFSSGVPHYNDGFSPVANGVLAGLHIVIHIIFSRSFAHVLG
jgi:hypothetical protein